MILLLQSVAVSPCAVTPISLSTVAPRLLFVPSLLVAPKVVVCTNSVLLDASFARSFDTSSVSVLLPMLFLLQSFKEVSSLLRGFELPVHFSKALFMLAFVLSVALSKSVDDVALPKNGWRSTRHLAQIRCTRRMHRRTRERRSIVAKTYGRRRFIVRLLVLLRGTVESGSAVNFVRWRRGTVPCSFEVAPS